MSDPQEPPSPPLRSGGTILGGGRRRAGVEPPPDPSPAPTEADGALTELTAPDRSIHDDLASSSSTVGAPIEGPAAGARPGQPPQAVIWKIALAAMTVIALVAALLGLQQRSKRNHDRQQAKAVQDTSGQWVGALTNLDYQHLDSWRSNVLRYSTGSVNSSFDKLFGSLEQLYTADHLRGTGTVQNIFVGSVAGGKASTVVLVNVTVTGLTGTRQYGSYAQLSLLNVHGKWLIDTIDEVNFPLNSTGSAGTPAAGTAPSAAPSTPSTTARP